MAIPPFGSPPTPDASSSKKGKVKLANDLTGAADSPQVANLHLTGDTSIGHKLTNLTNGSSAQDAAAFGQIPTSLPPNGSAGGDLTGTYPNPTIKASVGLTGNPTATTQTAGDNSTRIATDAFVTTAVSNAIAAVNPAVAVAAATTSASNTSNYTYNNGASGVGATLTGVANTPLTVDGFTFTAVNQRILVKNDTQSPSGAFNGIYFVSQIQTAVVPVILTRALDYDMPSDMNNTGAIPVVNGTTNGSTTWVLTSAVATVGTDPLTYTEFSLNPAHLITDTTSAGGDLTGTYPNPTLAAIVSGTTVGDATHIPVITYDNKGRITGTTTASPTASTQRTFAYFVS